jgi:hypothetical protein
VTRCSGSGREGWRSLAKASVRNWQEQCASEPARESGVSGNNDVG